MPVKILSYVSNNNNGSWKIKLTDTLEDKSVICNDIDEYEKKLQEITSDYGSDIEVIWEKAKDLTPQNIADLQNKILILEEKYKKEIEAINNKKTTI